jgi:hypothetical protein
MGFFTRLGRKARGVGYKRRKSKAFKTYSDAAAGWPNIATRKSVQRRIRKDDRRYLIDAKPRMRRKRR